MSLHKVTQLLFLIFISTSNLSYAETYFIGALQEVVYYEARGDGDESMIAVAQVVLNRVRHKKFPYSISEVRSQRKQFSYYNKVPFKNVMRDQESAIKSLLIAVGVYTGIYYKKKFKDSVMYHVCEGKRKVKPKWHWWKLNFDGKVGTQCFYSYK